jgi:hypothetical protein
MAINWWKGISRRKKVRNSIIRKRASAQKVILKRIEIRDLK